MLQPTSLFFLTYFAILASQVGAFSNFLRYADNGQRTNQEISERAVWAATA
jgi:hypothetical protein